jgi:hypothetical protein
MASIDLIARLKKNGTMQIEPEEIFGFRVGRPLDFDAYCKLGFRHPRPASYYNLSDLAKAHPQIAEYYHGILASKSIDDPIEVFADDNNNLIVLDGASRLACIAYIKAKHPELFGKVPVTIFKGNTDLAKVRMIRRNWIENKKPLTDYEFMQSIAILHQNGMTPQDICAGLGRNSSYLATIYNIIKCMQNLEPAWHPFLRDGDISRDVAIKLAECSKEVQQEELEKYIDKGKISSKEIDAKNANKKTRVGPILDALDCNITKLTTHIESSGLIKIDPKLYEILNGIYSAILDFQKAYERAVAKQNEQTESKIKKGK